MKLVIGWIALASMAQAGQSALSYNQLQQLDTGMRASYLKQQARYTAQLERTKNTKTKKYSFWHMVAGIQVAEAAKDKICMNLGWFEFSPTCDSKFEPVGRLKSLPNVWKEQKYCAAGAMPCNPFVYGPGVCGTNNDSRTCFQNSQSAGQDSGIQALNKMINECGSSNANTADCKALKKGINEHYDNVQKACADTNTRTSAVICQRSQQAIAKTRKSFEEKVNKKMFGPVSMNTCKVVGKPRRFQIPGGDDKSCKPQVVCASTVQGCPNSGAAGNVPEDGGAHNVLSRTFGSTGKCSDNPKFIMRDIYNIDENAVEQNDRKLKSGQGGLI